MMTGVNRVGSGACHPLFPSQAFWIPKQLYKAELSLTKCLQDEYIL